MYQTDLVDEVNRRESIAALLRELGNEHVTLLERAYSFEERRPLHEKLVAFWARPEMDQLAATVASSVRDAIAAVPLTAEAANARCELQYTPEWKAAWQRELAASQRKYHYGKPLSVVAAGAF